MLDDPSIELIAVESNVRGNMNFGYAQKAIAAGKHVHLDKPPGDSLPALKELLESAAKQGQIVQLGYQWRYHPAMQKAIEAARKGWLGHIYMVRATINKPLDQAGRDYDAVYSGGMMFDLGSHMIDRIVDLLGKPKTIQGWVRHDSTVNDKLADNTLAVFEFEKAMAEVYIAAQQPHGNTYRTFEILGTEGTATVRPFFPEMRLHLDLAHAAGPYKAGLQTIDIPLVKQAPYEPDFLVLAGMIRNGDTPEYSIEHDLNVQEALLKACKMM
jgi:predicted dehydrogenase